MKTSERKKGISLIVLIITIVVMMIIAAAIILNIDDTKIINNAEKAAAENNLAAAKEIRVVAKAEWRANEDKLKKQGYSSFKAYLEHKLESAGIADLYISNNGVIYNKYTDSNGEMIPVPKGFVVSSISTENEVAEGLVIYEGAEPVTDQNIEEASTTRNQYVWVPVYDISNFERYDISGYGSITVDRTASYNLDSAAEVAEYEAMLASVTEYGGFYISRYPAQQDGDNSLLSKKDGSYWYNITWSEAKDKCKSLNSEDIVGHLIYGEEWDATQKFGWKNVVKSSSSSNGMEWTYEYVYESKRVLRRYDSSRWYAAESSVASNRSFRCAIYLK